MRLSFFLLKARSIYTRSPQHLVKQQAPKKPLISEAISLFDGSIFRRLASEADFDYSQAPILRHFHALDSGSRRCLQQFLADSLHKHFGQMQSKSTEKKMLILRGIVSSASQKFKVSRSFCINLLPETEREEFVGEEQRALVEAPPGFNRVNFIRRIRSFIWRKKFRRHLSENS